MLTLEIPENIEAPMQELMQTGRWHGELRLQHSRNSVIDVLLSVTILPDTAGDPWKIIIPDINITEEKQAEEVISRTGQ